jgi:hypothetical protein
MRRNKRSLYISDFNEENARGDRTRTYDLMLPKQARVEEEVSEISLVAYLSSGVRFQRAYLRFL